MIYTISSYDTSAFLYSADTVSLMSCFEMAASQKVSLIKADMRNLNFDGANMKGSDFTWAAMTDSTFSNCDFRYSLGLAVDMKGSTFTNCKFDGADLRNSDLRGVDLTTCSFNYARLQRTQLDSTLINWNDHCLCGEILSRDAGTDPIKRQFTGYVMFELSDCWPTFLSISNGDVLNWALNTMSKYVQPGDNAPSDLKQVAIANNIIKE